MDVAAARAAFDYPAAERTFKQSSSKALAGATVRDVTYPSVGGRTVSALLVVPTVGWTASRGTVPALVRDG